jgi:multidrug efflux pump subunit AcrB
MAGNMHVKLYGYNYDDLYRHAETFRDTLLTFRRIKEVLISSQFSYYKDDYVEYVFSLDRQRMAVEDLRPSELFASLSPVFMRDVTVGRVVGDDQVELIKMSSRQSRLYDLWSLANLSRSMSGKYYKTSEIANIVQAQTPQNIIKENQQYVLSLQYDYVGAYQQANRILDTRLEEFNKALPMGYTAVREGRNYMWSRSDNKQYLFLALIIVIIIFMTSILFNSLKQPLAIIFIIPVSYIGVFLTFYLFKLNFDQGGFASFVLLCAITINASIYLINEYNRIRMRKPLITPVKAYIKAWNIKIMPIFLTIISTILGFIPFMVGLDRESFWFPLAAGTIGGLIMSFVGIYLFLPLFLIKRRIVIPKRKKKRKE